MASWYKRIVADLGPIIDLTPWFTGGADGQRAVAATVDEALRTSGFLLITGHGVPDEVRAAAETHRELPPEYQTAVIESFLSKVDREIDARVDARLAGYGGGRGRRPAPA